MYIQEAFNRNLGYAAKLEVVMSVSVTCPKCGKSGTAPDEALGKKCRCIYCKTIFKVQPAAPNATEAAVAERSLTNPKESLLRSAAELGGMLGTDLVGTRADAPTATDETVAEADLQTTGRTVWQQLKDRGRTKARQAMPGEIKTLLGIMDQFPQFPGQFREQIVQDLHSCSLWEAAALWVDYAPWPDSKNISYPRNVEMSRILIRAGRVALAMLEQ